MPTWTGAIAERLAELPLIPPAPPTASAETVDLSADGLDGPAEWVRKVAARALDEGATHYTSRPGLPKLRAAIAERLNARHGTALTPDDVVITDGGTEAIHVALRILLADRPAGSPPRPLLFTQPGRILGPATARWLDAPAVPIPVTRGGLDPARLLDAVATDAGDPLAGGIERGVLCLANPDQPTGVALERSAAERLGEAVVRRDLRLLLDETLLPALLPGREAPSPLVHAEVAARTVLVGSFSVAYRLAGWRVGYLATPTAPLRAMRALKQAISICSAAVSQHAALAALERTPPEWLARQAEAAQLMLAAAQARLSGAGFPTPLPDAYPFLWVDISASGLTSTAAARRLAEPAGREPAVLVAPGTRFAAGTRSRVGEGFIRLTLDPAGPPLLPAIERLIETLRGRTL